MRSPPLSPRWFIGIPLLGALTAIVSANDILTTTGFTTCMANSEVTVTALNIQYDRTTQQITFDVAGTSSKAENVTAALYVTAYGKQVYQKTFNPCDESSKVDQLCPGEFLKHAYDRFLGADIMFQSQQGHLQPRVCKMFLRLTRVRYLR